MGNEQKQGDVQTRIAFERELTYGDSWRVSGEIVDQIWPHTATLSLSGYFHPWYMILTKLVRLLHSPEHLDSWRDIVGFANLVIADLEAKHVSS